MRTRTTLFLLALMALSAGGALAAGGAQTQAAAKYTVTYYYMPG